MNRARNLGVLHGRIQVLVISAAPIHLDVIESPFGELQKVLIVVPFAARMRHGWAEVWPVEATSRFTSVRVDTCLESLRVNGSYDIGHVAVVLARLQGGPLFRFNDDIAVCIARSEPPTLVNIDVLITRQLHSGR